jgi:hypothetical protein
VANYKRRREEHFGGPNCFPAKGQTMSQKEKKRKSLAGTIITALKTTSAGPVQAVFWSGVPLVGLNYVSVRCCSVQMLFGGPIEGTLEV